MVPVRGHVVWATVDDLRKPWLIISNNARNNALPSCLAVRITTTKKPDLPSIVALEESDAPVVGRVLCDDINVLYPDEDNFEYLSALHPATMERVNAGLRAAVGL